MLEKMFPRDYFKERRLLVLAGLALLSMAITVTRVLVQVRQYDRKVTTGYTQYGADSFKLGEWYILYEPAIFALITTSIALFLSLRLFKMDRKLAYAVVLLQHIVLIFLFVVSGALLGASAINS